MARAVPQPKDPGAEALASVLASHLEARPADEAGMTLIGLSNLQNQSHAGLAEFSAFRRRLAEVLCRAGRDLDLRFTVGGGEVHYRLDGTAYLVTADGFDQWELYLRLTPADAAWTLWQSDRPIRVLRQPRLGQPQFTTVLTTSP